MESLIRWCSICWRAQDWKNETHFHFNQKIHLDLFDYPLVVEWTSFTIIRYQWLLSHRRKVLLAVHILSTGKHQTTSRHRNLRKLLIHHQPSIMTVMTITSSSKCNPTKQLSWILLVTCTILFMYFYFKIFVDGFWKWFKLMTSMWSVT